MESDYEQTLDENFNKALELCSNEYCYEDLIGFLKSGNIPEKQFAALEISEIKTQDDAGVFLSNLINCDGKIREAVAQKFSELVLTEKYREFFSEYPKVLAKSTIDINANIARMVIESLEYMYYYEEFGKEYSAQLLEYIKEAFDGLDKIVFRDKKYTINKQLFKLYWCLEGLNVFYSYLNEDVLFYILEKTLKQNEYTVREKAVQILVKLTSEKFDSLKQLVKDDENYYVKRVLKK